jgi:hypothetical protein
LVTVARLALIGLIAVPLGCGSDAVEQCLSRLGITVEQGDFFVGDDFTATAEWTPASELCPADFSWSVSRNLQLVGGTTGAQVTYRGLEHGFGTVSLTAGAGEYASAQSVEVLRTTGDLEFVFTGLDDGAEPDIHVTGPGGFEQDVDRAELLRDVAPGEYTWTVNPVTGTNIGHEYAGASATGSATVQRAVTATATIQYERQTAQVDFDAIGVPDPSPADGEAVILLDNAAADAYIDEIQGGKGGKYSIYGKLVSATHTYLILTPHGSFAVIPDIYDWILFTRKGGYGFTPSIATGTLVATLASTYLLAVQWTATLGILEATLEGIPAGIPVTTQLTFGSTISSPVLPFTLSRLPGNYLLEILALTYLNTARNRTETWEPVQRNHSLALVAGQTLVLAIVMFLVFWIATFLSNVSVLSDPFGHALFIGFLAAILLTVRVDRVPDTTGPPGQDGVASAVTETITITAPSPWVTVTGPLQGDGTFVATGTGTVAGFPNVPVAFTGALNADGTISGTLQMGSDTAPTGLPNGSITYTIEGMPTSLGTVPAGSR